MESARAEKRPEAWVRGLDLLRVAAVLLVIAFHVSMLTPTDVAFVRWFGIVGHWGWAGVDLFFVLSGYLIASQYFGKAAQGTPIPIGRFYLRRFLRTLPNYFVVFAITYLIVVYVLGQPWPALWKYFVFLQNFDMPVDSFIISWSLCVEEHFYLVFPLVAGLLLAKKSAKWAALLAGVILVGEPILRAIIWLEVRPDVDARSFFVNLYYPTYTRLDGLTLGVGLAAINRLHPALWAKIARRSNAVFCGGVVTTALAMACSFRVRNFLSCSIGFSLFSAGFAMLVASVLDGTSWLARLRIPGIKSLALLSYATYLTHMPALRAGVYLGRDVLHQNTMLVIAPLQAGFIVILALALYVLVERPTMQLRDALLRTPARGPTTTTSGEISS